MLINGVSSSVLLGIVMTIQCYSFSLSVSTTSSNVTDLSALLFFRSSTNLNPNGSISSGNWTRGTDFCNWVGITCSQDKQRVMALQLPYMGLQGTIPPYIGNLSFLAILDLSGNKIHGPIPDEISRLFRLRLLILESNQLEGNVPASLYHCQSLEEIALSGNMLSGGIPMELGMLPSLGRLYLDGNDLSGRIPASLGNLSALQNLNLSGNSLTGSFPSAILNASSLAVVDLQTNHFSGYLPPDICTYLANLEKLVLSYNQFSGPLPPGITNCSRLVTLSLSANSFQGTIPQDIGNLGKLETLLLMRNSLTGRIPLTIANMSMLQAFDVSENKLEGSIPSDIGSLLHLSNLQLTSNNLSGSIPPELFNMSTLQTLRLTFNSLSGSLPSKRPWHPNLELVYLGGNKLGGRIPLQFSNISKLREFAFSWNFLTGPIPKSLGSLKLLQHLSMGYNQLTGEVEEKELGLLAALSNCRSLRRLHLDGNPLNVVLPQSIGNLSDTLEFFTAPGCGLTGHIPPGIGSLKSLTTLNLSANNLQGSIPASIAGLQLLQRLYLGDNSIVGIIPEELCDLSQLGELSLEENRISGLIPNCIGNLSYLQVLLLSSNRLFSSIPGALWTLQNLYLMNLSSNYLEGDLPENIGHLKVTQVMDLSRNQIGGNIPAAIGGFQSLNSLNLSSNLFEGPIPQTFGDLKALESLDLSNNSLSGSIPECLEELSTLGYLNLSFNKLSGKVPDRGPFRNFTAESFLGNRALCSKQLHGIRLCPTNSKGLPTFKLLLIIVLPVLLVSASTLLVFCKCRKHNQEIPRVANLLHEMRNPGTISCRELREATNNFAPYNFLGEGGSGSVYRGTLQNGTTVAVKVLNFSQEEALKIFEAEYTILRKVRHRNLVKVIGSCPSPELTALMLQYMSNGSLDKLLYSPGYCLDLFDRVSIMLDVACAMEYLHHGIEEPIVHCDLKPSNILLDQDMVAHVADFGIAKVLLQNDEASLTRTLGTLGYIAPEYGFKGKVSIKGDVYSFGIVLMEILTKRKPVDEIFVGGLSLKQWVSSSLPHKLMGIVDRGLFQTVNECGSAATEAVILSVTELAMECCREAPEDRVDMKYLVVKLGKLKLELSAFARSRLSVYAD